MLQCEHPSSPGLHVVQAQEHSAALLQHLQAEQRHEEERRISVVEQLQERRKVGIMIIVMIMIIIIVMIMIIMITRPKPAYGGQGLEGSWGQDTDEVSTFLVFLTSHFALAALSLDLTNLGPLMTMKIHLETSKTMETNQKP